MSSGRTPSLARYAVVQGVAEVVGEDIDNHRGQPAVRLDRQGREHEGRPRPAVVGIEIGASSTPDSAHLGSYSNA